MCVWKRRGLRKSKKGNLCMSSLKSSAENHNVKRCAVYCTYKQILYGYETRILTCRLSYKHCRWGEGSDKNAAALRQKDEKLQFLVRSERKSTVETNGGTFRWAQKAKSGMWNPTYEGSQRENKQYEESSMASAALLSTLSNDHIPASELHQLQ